MTPAPLDLPTAAAEAVERLEATSAGLAREAALRLIGRLHEIEASIILRLANEGQRSAPQVDRSPAPAPPPLLTVQDLVGRIGHSDDWIYRHLDEIPHTRLGRAIRFSETQVRRYVERNEIGT